jgi:TPP-dependent pyruvate/acetoin dehydrogenase alpha subunit
MNIPEQKLLPMYRLMVLIRKFEEKAMQLFLNGQLPGFLHSSIGQEAIPVGMSGCLREQDYIVSTHRGHGDILAKGAKPDRMMAELFGKSTGYCKGKGGSMHIADLDLGILGATGIVGGSLPIINGAALACQMRGTDQVGVCYFGDGASNEGSFHEALNLASIWQLPVVFVCQNNLYAESTPLLYHQRVKDIADRAASYGMEGFSVDGNDVFAVYAAACPAVEKARRGGGPTLLNCWTYRLTGHYVGDSGATYRSAEEVEAAKKREPLSRFRQKLLSLGVLTEQAASSVECDIEEEIAQAVRFAQESPDPGPHDLEADVYCI